MVEIVNSTIYVGNNNDMLALLKELAEDLSEKCGMRIQSESMTETDYEVILIYSDNYTAIKITATYNPAESTNNFTYKIYTGYYTTEFVEEAASTYVVQPRNNANRFFTLYIGNSGAFFTAQIFYPSSGSGSTIRVDTLNTIKIVNESDEEYYCISAVTATTTGTAESYKDNILFTTIAAFPVIRHEGNSAALTFPLQSNTYVNMGTMLESDVVAFPWVLYAAVNWATLGIPTVGGKKVYKILNRHTAQAYFPAYEEVTIGDKRFVNIGQNLIIESD